jgi:hypothetical protein
LTIRENINVSFQVLHFNILNSTYVNGIYLCLEYCGVLPKAKAKVLPYAVATDPSCSIFICLGPICVPDESPFLGRYVSLLNYILLFALQLRKGTEDLYQLTRPELDTSRCIVLTTISWATSTDLQSFGLFWLTVGAFRQLLLYRCLPSC